VDLQLRAGLPAHCADPPAAAQTDRHDHLLRAERHVDDGRSGQAEHPLECGSDAHVVLLSEPLSFITQQPASRAAARRSDPAQLPRDPAPAQTPAHAGRPRRRFTPKPRGDPQFNGELVDVFDLIQNATNRPPGRGFTIAAIRSSDHGATWSRRAITIDRHNTFQGLVVDPDDPNAATRLVRTGDIVPQVTVDPRSGAIYVVFQDSRFGPRSSIASRSRSTAG
jgi:hypothetical protein